MSHFRRHAALVKYPGPGTALSGRLVARVSPKDFLYCLILSKELVCQEKVLPLLGQWRRERKIVFRERVASFRVAFAHKQAPEWPNSIFFYPRPIVRYRTFPT